MPIALQSIPNICIATDFTGGAGTSCTETVFCIARGASTQSKIRILADKQGVGGFSVLIIN